jgi:GNAT superfamily N-acetyltransferase
MPPDPPRKSRSQGPTRRPGLRGSGGMLNMLVFRRAGAGYAAEPLGLQANFFVLAGHRASGVGSRLLEACVQHADQERFARIVLSPSERSRPLYQRWGLRPADSLMVRNGRD